MSERREGRTLTFRPSATLADIYNALRGPMTHDDAEVAMVAESKWLEKTPAHFLQLSLVKIFHETQNRNDQWAEEKFRQLRDVRGEWSLDGMWVDESGEIVGNALWSTYSAFSRNYTLAFETEDLIAAIKRRNQMVYPMGPKRDTVLFWQVQDEGIILPVIESVSDRSNIEEYPSAIDSEVIRMCRIRRGKVGPAAFASAGIILGKLGFWESRRLALGSFGFGVYVQRVIFRDSPLLPKGAYVSPLDPEQVKAKGGRIMEEKYPDTPVVRVDPLLAEEDFIAAVLSSARPIDECPVVLSYTTPSIRLGEGPKHGTGRTASEPAVSHL